MIWTARFFASIIFTYNITIVRAIAVIEGPLDFAKSRFFVSNLDSDLPRSPRYHAVDWRPEAKFVLQ
jgi:hypothetical protein